MINRYILVKRDMPNLKSHTRVPRPTGRVMVGDTLPSKTCR